MRALRNLTLLLALVAPAAFAENTYQVEMILVRQNAVPAITSQFAPEDWREGAQFPAEGALRQPVLTDEAEKLTANPQYTVLLHKAWRQAIGSEPSRVAISDGKEQFGHFPIEGNLNLTEGRFVSADVKFWVNKLGNDGSVLQSEAFSQANNNMKVGALTFLDGGHLAVLLKVTPEGGARPPVDTNEIAE